MEDDPQQGCLAYLPFYLLVGIMQALDALHLKRFFKLLDFALLGHHDCPRQKVPRARFNRKS